MTNLFLYGTLRHPALLELVSGRAWGALAPEAARLADHRAAYAEGHDFPLIEPAPGDSAEGLLLRDVAGDVLERLNFYELGFGYELRACDVEAGGGAVRADVYFPRPGLWKAGERFDLEGWQRGNWVFTRHAAAEVMGYFGRLSPEEVVRRWHMIATRAHAAVLAEADPAPCDLRGRMGRGDVTLEAEELSHAGYFLLKTLHLRHKRFDGAMSEEMEREVFLAGDAAILLPYDPLRDRVMLVEQFRMGPYARGDLRPWQLEPVAGRIDRGEAPEEAARREAVEETGLRLSRLEKIASCYSTPGYSSEVYHCFLGLADLPDGAAGLGGAEEEQEDIRSHIIGFDAAMRLIGTGEAQNAPLILSLLWLARERGRLRAEAGAAEKNA